MIYSVSIAIPASVDKASAQKTIVSVTRGLVYRMEVEFPPGCLGLAYCQVFDGPYQLFPATPGEAFHSDGRVIAFDDLYLKTAAPFEFQVMTWNGDESYSHTLRISIAMASQEAFMSRYMPSISWDKFSQALAQAEADQEKEKKRQFQKAMEKL